MHRLLGPLTSAALGAACLLVATSPADASRPGDAARFQTWVGYDVGRAPTAVDAADFNGDGLADAAWARNDHFENSVSVTLNLGDGTLGGARTYPTTSQSTDLAAADLDGDGDVDLAVAARGNGFDNSVIDIFLNDGTGRFARTTTSGGHGPERITAGDVDADGDIDLVLANYNQSPDGTVSVLRNNGEATFAPEETTPVGTRVHDVVIRDLTGDGSTDLGAVRLNEDVNRYELHVLQQGADDTFRSDSAPQQFDVSTNGGVGSPTLVAGDLDADADHDLVVGGGATSENAVLTNDGSGDFAVRTYPAQVSAVRLADLDSDGDRDIVGVGGGGGTRGVASVQRNDGDGTFSEAETSVTGSNPMGLDVADLQGDGRPDLLVAARDIGAGVTHRQLPGGRFAAPDGGQLFAPTVGVTTGDLDGDGDADVAAALTGDFTTGTSIRVLANDGSGALSALDDVASDAAPRSLTAVDLDEDGDRDLSWLAGRGDLQVVTTAYNDGTGSFAAPVTSPVSTCSDHLSYGDVDNDGDLDRIVGNEDFCSTGVDIDRVSVSRNDGSGGFPTEQLVRMAQFTGDVGVAHVDRDGVPDLVGASGLVTTDDIAVAMGDGAGGFADPLFTTTGARHREIVVRDLDGDRAVDVASISYENGTAVLLGDSTGAFVVDFLEGEEITGYRNAVGIAAGDVDGDAILDLVVANESGSDLGVHSGLGDGSFEPTQVRYGMRPRVTDVALADLDGNGVLDIVSPAQLPGSFAAPRRARTAAAPSPGLSLLLGRTPRCTIVGTPGPDVLVGTRRTDVICGGGGGDRLRGFGGGDVLRGGAGSDAMHGLRGVDTLAGGAGADTLVGGRSEDGLRGGPGVDRLYGGTGTDTLDLLDRSRTAEWGDAGAGVDHCRADRSDRLSGCP